MFDVTRPLEEPEREMLLDLVNALLLHYVGTLDHLEEHEFQAATEWLSENGIEFWDEFLPEGQMPTDAADIWQ